MGGYTPDDTLLCSEKSKYFDFSERFDTFAEKNNSMIRRVSNSLVEWKNSPKRMPLIINGARQVGKTYIVEQFGKEHYESVLSGQPHQNKMNI